MFYWISISPEKSLYSKPEQANSLLSALSLQCQKIDGTLLDYSLEPLLLKFLVMVPLDLKNLPWRGSNVLIKNITSRKELLAAYSNLSQGLPSQGKAYEYCGMFEVYHKSNCFCLLGKVAKPNYLPPLEEILKWKKKSKYFDKKILPREFTQATFSNQCT
ncbi:hypothetical protein [uncultured Sphaerochaeta sp.]|uniref:hypothetical protein n=1 Tax=uncultured Sphaerochaeta sp. TaxID=886478 RepID=UPI002A0A4E53|nr:hypothetical protein [uncultured Sphaerochaeta sp.]